MFRIVFHMVCYYIVWFTCILSASHHYYWLGLVTSIFFTSIQYYIQVKANQSRHLLILIGSLTLTGFVIDSIFAKYNLLVFQANPFYKYLTPPWMIALWLNFSTVLYACLKKYFLKNKILAFLSLFGFPLAYYVGVSLGAATLPKGNIGLLIIGLTWSIVLPGILYVYEKLLGSSEQHT